MDEEKLYSSGMRHASLEEVKAEEKSEKRTRDMAGNIGSMMDFLEEF